MCENIGSSKKNNYIHCCFLVCWLGDTEDLIILLGIITYQAFVAYTQIFIDIII